MATIPLWLRGRDITYTITAQTVDAAGVLADGTAYVMTGTIDEGDLDSQTELEEISPMTTIRHNNVPIKDGTSCSITEILSKIATNNKLSAAFAANDYFKVVAVVGPRTFTYYGTRNGYREGWRKGKMVAQGGLAMVDIGSANPLIT